MYYKDVETDYPSYEFGSRAEMMTWMKTPMGIATTIAIIALLVFIVYWFFIRKEDAASKYSYY